MNKYFHSNLRYLRNKNGTEQLELAEMMGLKSASAVSEWESGKRIPNAGVLSDLASIFRVSIDSLMNIDLENTRISSNSLIPLLGTIAAGSPILAEENIEDYFNLDSRVKADFCLRVKGDSMIDAGIHHNDIVFIKKQCDVDNGEIAAVIINDEATLKTVHKTDHALILQPANKKYQPLVFTEGNVHIVGKLVAVLNLR